ncbi:hypothetical protein D8O27_24990 [Burkholderia mallei]|nr:hypothetical protein BMA0224 [Burkholderia mallei ATCC 23344]RKN90101.1 hypothetical protein D8O31_29940 [Burkholderia mallei]RKN90970.1 hypothetical protein D8O03_29985 [Burkholderia mallei]RKO02138.1 hypothetical protein D8O05_18160 [Burkholderia mallei]RKO08537.1 hypothetical protein D8O04_27420 [Burkholderia mallei]
MGAACADPRPAVVARAPPFRRRAGRRGGAQAVRAASSGSDSDDVSDCARVRSMVTLVGEGRGTTNGEAASGRMNDRVSR